MNIKKLLILAVALRLLVAGFLFHPDIKTFNYQSSFLRKGVFNIYTYLTKNSETLPLKENFVYFPLTYLTLGAYQFVATPLLGSGFDSWLASANSNTFVLDSQIFKYLVILKLPYLALDILIAFLLLNYFGGDKGKKAFTIWLFNPFTIFIIYAFGNVDIFPVLLTLASLLLLKKNKLLPAAAVLGLAAGFKLYPLLFAPFLAFAGKTNKEKLLLGTIPFAVFGIICLPFLSGAFLQSTLISGLTTRLFNPGIVVGFGESIIIGLMLLMSLFFYIWLADKDPNIFNYWLTTLLIIFSFSHFHIAWLLWIAPLMVILAVKSPKLSWAIFLSSFLIILIPLLYQDRSMSISLYRIYSTWFDLLPTPFIVIQKFFDPFNLQSILHSLFAGASAMLVYLLFKEKTNSAQKLTS